VTVPTSGAAPTPALPPSLRWAVWLILGEAAVLAIVGAYLAYEDLTAVASDTGRALAVTGYVLIIAGVLVLAAVHLRRRRAWPRGLVIALQLMAFAAAFYLMRGGALWLGLPVGITAVAIIALLVAPSTRESLGIQ
jgi:hypothetical protein